MGPIGPIDRRQIEIRQSATHARFSVWGWGKNDACRHGAIGITA